MMDMAVEVVDAVRGLHLVVAGCSDGVLRVRVSVSLHLVS